MKLAKLDNGKMIILIAIVIGAMGVIFFVITNLHLFGRALHLVSSPNDLYHPIIVDQNFRWDVEGSRVYALPCSYYDVYEVGMRTDKKVLPSGLLAAGGEAFHFRGKLKIRVLKGAKVLHESITQEPLASWLFKGDDNYFSQLSFATFPMPLYGYCEGLHLEVTVLSTDEHLQSLASPQLYVRVSAIP